MVALGRLHVYHLVTVLIGVEKEGAVELWNSLASDFHWDSVPHPVLALRSLKRLSRFARFASWFLCPRQRSATESNEEVRHTRTSISNNGDIVASVAVRSR